MLERENISIKLIFIAFQTVFPSRRTSGARDWLNVSDNAPEEAFSVWETASRWKRDFLCFVIVPHKTMDMTLDKVLSMNVGPG